MTRSVDWYQSLVDAELERPTGDPLRQRVMIDGRLRKHNSVAQSPAHYGQRLRIAAIP